MSQTAAPKFEGKRIPFACMAPALTDETLDRYRQLAAAAAGPVRDSMLACLVPIGNWWELPDSKRTDGERLKIMRPVSGTFEGSSREMYREIVYDLAPLEDSHKEQLDDLIPWSHEIAAMQGLFETIPAEQKELRDAAFHLLWHLKELDLGREPATLDRLR